MNSELEGNWKDAIEYFRNLTGQTVTQDSRFPDRGLNQNLFTTKAVCATYARVSLQHITLLFLTTQDLDLSGLN